MGVWMYGWVSEEPHDQIEMTCCTDADPSVSMLRVAMKKAYQEVLLPCIARMLSFTSAQSMIPKLSAREAMTTSMASIGRFLHTEHR